MGILSQNIVLVGFMASGKTLSSKEIAIRLGRERVSTDDLIVEHEQMPITEIFAKKGEAYFRDVERAVVRDCAARSGLVIDCGGGVAVFEENWAALKPNGVSFYLYASPESVLRRTKGKTDRPLLNVEDPLSKIKELLAKRDPHYRKADFVVDSNEDDIGKVVNVILALLEGRPA